MSDFSPNESLKNFPEVTQNYDLIYNTVPDSGLVKNIEEVYKSNHLMLFTLWKCQKRKRYTSLLSTFRQSAQNLDLYGSGPERVLW